MPVQRNASALSGASASTPVIVRIAAAAWPARDSFCARLSNRRATGDNDSEFAPIFTMVPDSLRDIAGLPVGLCQGTSD
ncbi:MAG TPA: hypothetical protein VFJ87_02200 [Rhodanobacteraceae bacterium]|nr:hypothetical protein [Rhodanobacteraceae bacterium]